MSYQKMGNGLNRFEEDSNIKEAIVESGMNDRKFYKFASEEMKKELHALSRANTIRSKHGNYIAKKQLFFEEDERSDD